MTVIHSRMRAVTLAALLVISALTVVVTPATVSAQTGNEPNDTRENATAIDTNEFFEGGIDEADGNADVDWYQFDVAAGDHLRVVSAEGYGVGSSYTLYGPGGTVLGSGDEYGTEDAPVAGAVDAAGGTYYLEVTNDDGFAGESYGFNVETTAPDTFEPNEKRDEAVPTEPGTAHSGAIATGDVDWFAVSVAAGETIDTNVGLTDTRSLGYIGDNNVDLALYDPTGNEVGENPEDISTHNAPADQTSRFDGRFAVTQRTVVEETGTYYVRVAGVDTTGFSRYDLTTAVSSANGGNGSGESNSDDGRSENGSDGNDDSESGGDDGSSTFENATAVDSLSAIPNGQIGADGNADVYSFEMREGSQVEIMQGIGGGAYPVTLLDEDGRVIGRIADQEAYRGEEDLLRANASDTGTYYLKIDGASGDRYSILGSVTEPDANEPNDDRATATTIITGDAIQGTIVRGATDYYVVSLDAGETVDVFANATAKAALTVYGPSGSTIESVEIPSRFDGDTEAPTTSVTAEESGTYYLELSIQSNAIGQVGGEYAIELRSVDGTDDQQSSGGGSIDGETGDDVSDDEESNTDAETPTESTAPAPTEQTAVETANGTTSADAGSDDTTPSDSTPAPNDTTGGPDDVTTGTVTSEEETGGDDEVTSDETTGNENDANGETTSAVATNAQTAEDDRESTNGEDAATTTAGNAPTEENGDRSDDTTRENEAADAETAGTTSAANTTEDSSNVTPRPSGEAGEGTNESAGTAPSGGAEKTAVDGPGFGLLAALLAVLGVGVFALGRD